MFTEWRGLPDSLVTRWSYSATTFLVLSPIFIYSMWARLYAVADMSLGGSLLLALSAAVTGFAFLWALTRILDVLDRPRRVTALRVMSVWVVAGSVTFATVAFGRAALGGAAPFNVAGWLLTVAVIVLCMALATYGAAVLMERRDQLAQLESRQADLSLLQDDAMAFARDQRAALVRTIEDTVSPELQRLRAEAARLGDASLESVQQLLVEVSAYSSDVVRSLSRDIASGDDRAADAVNTMDTDAPFTTPGELRRVVLLTRLSVPLVAFATLFLGLAQFRTQCVGPLLAALAAFVVVVGLLGIVGLLPWLRRPGICVAWLLLSTMAGYAVFRWLLARDAAVCQWDTSPTLLTVGLIMCCLSILALATVIEASSQVWRAIGDVRVANERIAESTRLLRVDGAATRDQVSQILHGPVQGRLAAISLALQLYLSDLREGLNPSAQELRERVTHLLDEASADLHGIIERRSIVTVGLVQAIEREREQWRGLVVISADISDAALAVLERSPYLSELAGECVEEAVTNASRHGRARAVNVRVAVEGASLLLTIDDDGAGVVDQPTPGLGLSRITLLGGTWALDSRTPRGSRLTVRLSPQAVS